MATGYEPPAIISRKPIKGQLMAQSSNGGGGTSG
jgi:hypothetical protein